MLTTWIFIVLAIFAVTDAQKDKPLETVDCSLVRCAWPECLPGYHAVTLDGECCPSCQKCRLRLLPCPLLVCESTTLRDPCGCPECTLATPPPETDTTPTPLIEETVTPTTPECEIGGQVYKTCGTACPAVCGQSTPFFCTLQCVIGCQCPSGMHLDPDVNKCVTECPTSTTLPPTTITTETRPIPEDAAGAPQFCSMEPDSGPCRARIQRYHFNATNKSCKRFYYGGCGGNDNNFKTSEICLQTCGTSQVSDTPTAVGSRPTRPTAAASRPTRPTGGTGSRPTRPTGGTGSQPTAAGSRPTRPTGGTGSRPTRPTGGTGSRPTRPTGGTGSRPTRPTGGTGSRPTRPTGDTGSRPTQPTRPTASQPTKPTTGGTGSQPTKPTFTGETPAVPTRPTGGVGAQLTRPTGSQPMRPTITGSRPTGGTNNQPTRPTVAGSRPTRPTGTTGEPLTRPTQPTGTTGEPLTRPTRPTETTGEPLTRPTRPTGTTGEPLTRPTRPTGTTGEPLTRPTRPTGTTGSTPTKPTTIGTAPAATKPTSGEAGSSPPETRPTATAPPKGGGTVVTQTAPGSEATPTVNALCTLRKDRGSSCTDKLINQNVRRFYYNSRRNMCRRFSFRGCGGNANRFDTLQECENACTCKFFLSFPPLLAHFAPSLL